MTTVEEILARANQHKPSKSFHKYIRPKLDLNSNLLNYILKHEHLIPILYDYSKQENHDAKTRATYKEALASSGFDPFEQLQDAVLLVSEDVKTLHADDSKSDEEIGFDIFATYAADEEWNTHSFRFCHARSSSFQRKRIPRIEETVIQEIAKSRNYEKMKVDHSDDVKAKIDLIAEYFEDSFHTYFGTDAPVNIREVTNVTPEWANFADKIGRQTYVEEAHFLKPNFPHLVMHEAMHLCFRGFYENPLEEGLIEFYLQEMFTINQKKNFPYYPYSRDYQDYKQTLSDLFFADDKLLPLFTAYFLSGDEVALHERLQTYTEESMSSAEREHVRLKSNVHRGILGYAKTPLFDF